MKSKGELIEDLLPKVGQVAGSVAAYWPDTVEADDVEQELAVRLLEANVEWLRELAESPAAGITTVLRKAGMQVAAGERDDYELFSGNYRYSGDEVRKLLEGGALVFADELTSTERADITTAMDRLETTSPRYFDALLKRYVDFVDDRADKDVLSRAVRALTREMNRSFNTATAEHDGPAPRRGRK